MHRECSVRERTLRRDLNGTHLRCARDGESHLHQPGCRGVLDPGQTIGLACIVESDVIVFDFASTPCPSDLRPSRLFFSDGVTGVGERCALMRPMVMDILDR
jgi:hypothetical protein